MKIIFITQNEPFYLTKNIKYLLKILPNDIMISGFVVFKPSPFGKNQNLITKALKTLRIFGVRFFIYYSLKYIYSKVFTISLIKYLKKKKIKIINISGSINGVKSLNKLKKLKPDLFVSILGNQIFKKELISIPKLGCINLHTSLLPKYRGLMPTFWVLKNMEKYTGVSVFFVDEGIDSGPIIIQQKVLIDNMNQSQLIEHTKKIGMELISESIKKIKNGSFELIPNPNSEKSYFSFPTKNDVEEFKINGKKFF